MRVRTPPPPATPDSMGEGGGSNCNRAFSGMWTTCSDARPSRRRGRGSRPSPRLAPSGFCYFESEDALMSQRVWIFKVDRIVSLEPASPLAA